MSGSCQLSGLTSLPYLKEQTSWTVIFLSLMKSSIFRTPSTGSELGVEDNYCSQPSPLADYPPGDVVNIVSPSQIDRHGTIGGTFLKDSECDGHGEAEPLTPLPLLTRDHSFVASY